MMRTQSGVDSAEKVGTKHPLVSTGVTMTTYNTQQRKSQTSGKRKRLTESGNKRKCKDCKSKQASAWGSMTAIAFHI